MFKINQIDESLIDDLYQLNEEYFSWIATEIEELYGLNLISIIGQTIPKYVRSSLHDLTPFTPPKGIYYLIELNDKVVGMGALRKLRENLCEIKRMYIRPDYRGRGYGKILMQILLEKAKEYNYLLVRLDTGRFMASAQGLYRLVGFQERKEYLESEVPEEMKPFWLFMEKKI